MEKYSINHSKEIVERQKEMLPGGCHFNFHGTKMVQNIIYSNAEGSRIWDVDGNEYLDLYAKSGTMILGHCNKVLNSRINNALEHIVSVNDTETTERVLEKIRKCIPSMEMIRFGLSGSEVIQNALRLARAYTGKQKIVRFHGHFHGSGDNVLGNLFTNEYQPYDDLTEANSTEGRFEGALNETLILPWNNITILEKILKDRSGEIAALLMEPIMVNNGSIMPSADYMKQVRRLCDMYNVLLIYDEVITGFRVGLGGAQGMFDIVPDITVVGKAISNGVIPVSAFGGKREIMVLYKEQRVAHLGTYNGYPLAMEAIDATLEQLMNDAVYKNMKEFAIEIKKIMENTAHKMQIPLSVQGPELCMSYHFTKEKVKEYKIDKREVAKKAFFYSNCLSYGILFAAPSRLYLNTAMNENDIAFFEERIYEAFKDSQNILG